MENGLFSNTQAGLNRFVAISDLMLWIVKGQILDDFLLRLTIKRFGLNGAMGVTCNAILWQR